ncbi:MAG: LPS assembly protein LptD [Gammaproteobacteria bacterium]|nr:LPS assembly protein LptD [Gammaproteobacteria bacterium]
MRPPTLLAFLLPCMLPAALAGEPDLATALWSAEPGRGVCGGYPARSVASPEAPPGEQATVATAATLSRLGLTTTLRGNVVVRQGGRELHAPALTLDEEAQTARAEGIAELRDAALHLRGKNLELAMQNDSASLDQAEFVMLQSQMRGTADRVEKQGAGLRLTNTSLTGCPPGHDGWMIRADRIEIDQDETFATARDAQVRVGGMPVFRAPYLRFPVTERRVSGFLFPELSHGGVSGIELGLPYYLNLAPNYDATVVPRLMTRRGTGIDGEFRHKALGSDTELRTAWLGKDEQYNGVLSRRDWLRAGNEGVTSFDPADRWLTRLDHQGQFGAFRTSVNYAKASDRDYLADFGYGAGPDLEFASQVTLPSRAEARYRRGGWDARVWAQSFQPLTERPAPWRRVPEANLVYRGQLAGPLEWSLASVWSWFDRDDAALAEPSLVGRRMHVEPGARLRLARRFGFLNLGAAYRYTEWHLDHARSDATPHRALARASLDSGLFFERPLAEGWLQTLEPRVAYFRQQHAEQGDLPRFDTATLTFGYDQLFRADRFAGLDRIGDTHHISAAVVSRMLQAERGTERLVARVGAIAWLDDRRVTLGGRPGPNETRPAAFAGDMTGHIGPFRITGTAAWDTEGRRLDEAGLIAVNRSESGRIVSFGYRRRAAIDVDQTDIGIYAPLTHRLSVFGRWNHDWQNGQMVEGFAGFGWRGCCVEVKLLWRRLIDAPRHPAFGNATDPLQATGALDATPEDRVMLQVSLSGLAGFGRRIESHLERGVRGYRRAP